VDALDLVQFHWWDTNVKKYVQAALELKRLRDIGKIRHVGLTNFNTTCTREILEAGVPIVSTQVQYSVIDDRPSRELAGYYVQNGVALLCYGSLAGGFLSSEWFRKLEPTGPFENRSHTKYKLIIEDFGGWELFQELLGTLEGIAQTHGVSIGQIASSWTLHQPGVAAVIVGATSTRHLAQNLRIPEIRLSTDDLEAIQRVTDRRSGPQGDVYDLERDKDGRHGRIMKYNLNEDRT
jgi:aryl-alcohol dehydrogenase-like predicted oxidoreductase